MSWRGRSTYRPRPRRSLQPPELIGAMLESSDEEPKEEKPPTESWDPTADQKREDDQVAAEIQVPDPEADLKDLSQSKTGDEWGDGTDVQGKILQKPYQLKMPESDILSIKMQNYVLSVFHNIIILIIQRENITAPLKTESRVQMQTYFER
ncbi:X antigen family member 2-like [Trachypithecus francoisi]|uniref:X antigen family member 2-like n=1 Tax=Trachypithecus francoisi TaxID=54180 RepID=UPI00141ACA72|nr:X antigen family member 2-like [Trachypithecus francoisi]